MSSSFLIVKSKIRGLTGIYTVFLWILNIKIIRLLVLLTVRGGRSSYVKILVTLLYLS